MPLYYWVNRLACQHSHVYVYVASIIRTGLIYKILGGQTIKLHWYCSLSTRKVSDNGSCIVSWKRKLLWKGPTAARTCWWVWMYDIFVALICPLFLICRAKFILVQLIWKKTKVVELLVFVIMILVQYHISSYKGKSTMTHHFHTTNVYLFSKYSGYRQR